MTSVNVKVLRLFAISALLVATTCDPCVSAEPAPNVNCYYSKDKKTAFCSTDDPDDQTVWRCDKHKNGTWSCGALPPLKMTSHLKDAVIKALARSKQGSNKQ